MTIRIMNDHGSSRVFCKVHGQEEEMLQVWSLTVEFGDGAKYTNERTEAALKKYGPIQDTEGKEVI